MKQGRIPTTGSVAGAQQNIEQGLNPAVQRMFQVVLDRIRRYLASSTLRLSAPPSEEWITVKLHPKKAVLAFRDDDRGNLEFDIDTYEDNDITDPLGLFEIIPNPVKPNKRHVARIRPDTSTKELEYFIEKMIEGMTIFDRNA